MTSSVGPNTMINSIQADHRDASESLPIRDSIRFRNGSLPLKKRRLYDAIPRWELQVNNKIEANPTPSLPCSLTGTTSENPGNTFCPTGILDGSHINNCNKISFLALVAAAATAGNASQVPMSCNPFPTNTLLSNTVLSPQESDEQSISSKTLSSKRSSSSTSSPTELTNSNNHKTEKEGALRPNGRIHHPPLSSPLPNGCHGRTSRNNSYCRRQPCYNGSKYCKLHYQHYVIAGIRPADENTESLPTCIPIEGNNHSSTTVAVHTTNSTSAHKVVANNGQQQQQPLQQDKRFTGCDDEVRCEATTTRGRACAYVAVQGTKYCYLHADYDTNPPPRRGGGVAGVYPTGKLKSALNVTGPSTTAFAHKHGSILSTDQLAASPETVDVAPSFDKTLYPHTSPPSITSEESHSTSVSQQQVALDEAQEFLQNDAQPFDGEFPLLSTISPDQWYGKKVCIATGPLVGRTGIVEKWGNGWVGVRVLIGTEGVSDPHLHNRRALELYLLADQEEDSSATGATMAVYQAERQSEEMNRDNAVLRRCVSREADTAEARELMDSSNYKEGDEEMAYSMEEVPRSQNATPCFPSEVVCDNQEIKYEDRTGEETQRGTMIPESPMTPAHGMSTMYFSDSNFHFIPRSEESSYLNDDSRLTSSACQFDGTMVPTVTPKPISPRRVRVDEDLPLVHSLMMAQEGLKRKGSLDLLFGTAALERSRRTVHKPQRYEDKAMLIRKRGKEGEPEECASPRHGSATP